MNKITWVPDRNAGRKLDIRPVVDQIMITPEEAAHLKDAFKQMVENRKAVEASEEEANTVSQNTTEEADPRVDQHDDGV